MKNLSDTSKAARARYLKSLWEIWKRRARSEVNVFLEYIFQKVPGNFQFPGDGGNSFSQQNFHRHWHAHLEQHRYTGILAPRGHGKTQQIALGRVLWELGRQPNLRIKLVCQSDRVARERLITISSHIRQNPYLHRVFPRLRPQAGLPWTQSQITVERRFGHKDPSVEALGVLSSATGKRADLLIFDDAVDFRNAVALPALRSVVKAAFWGNWMNMLEPEGRLIYIATPWHRQDLTAELLNHPQFNFLCQPIDQDYTPLWPAKWPREVLLRRETEIGRREFARAFRLLALWDEEVLFPWPLLAGTIDRSLKPSAVDPAWPRFIGVDLALSPSAGADYTAFFVLAVDAWGHRYPLEALRGHLSSPATAKTLQELCQRHRPQLVLVESNAYQGALLEWMGESQPLLPLRAYVTGQKKMNSALGLPSLAIEMERNLWHIPLGGEEHPANCSCGLCLWLAEMSEYPVGKHDDLVMACFLAREAARMGTQEGRILVGGEPRRF